MKTAQIVPARPVSRLSHNKENVQYLNVDTQKRSQSQQNKASKYKHNYDIYFPKEAMKKKPFIDHPENLQAVYPAAVLKPKKSESMDLTCAKRIVDDVRKRINTKESQKLEQLQKRRKYSIGAVAYIPTTLDQLKQILKKR